MMPREPAAASQLKKQEGPSGKTEFSKENK